MSKRMRRKAKIVKPTKSILKKVLEEREGKRRGDVMRVWGSLEGEQSMPERNLKEYKCYIKEYKCNKKPLILEFI